MNVIFWALTEERSGKTISVIVRQIGNQEKEFFSVFENK